MSILNFSWTEIPQFISAFVILMSVYHSILYAVISETKKISASKVWNNIENGNYLGIILTLGTGLLLYNLYAIYTGPKIFLIAIAAFDFLCHVLVILTTYYLVIPILKTIDILKNRYLIGYALFPLVMYTIFQSLINLSFPPINFQISYPYLVFSVIVIFYFIYLILVISKSYSKIGFVHKPFLLGGAGGIFYFLSVALIFLILFNFKQGIRNMLYYYVFIYSFLFVHTILYFLRFVIDYPSLLQSKWKLLMPFDPVKVTYSITLAFLATSLFFTVKESPNFSLYQNVPYSALIATLFAISTAVALILTYIKIITQNSELSYWSYLKTGLFVHLIATFYVFSLTALLWSEIMLETKLIASMFWLLVFLFYLFYVLDLRTVIKDLDIPISYNKLDIVRYFLSLYLVFFLIFFGISFVHGKNIALGAGLESSPTILFFIAVFLLTFTIYLSVTHKGLEELLKINVWSELSYIASFAAFIVVYFFYRSMDLQRFPLRDLFFVGYFATLMIEIVSIRTLGVESKYRKRKETIQDLLNYHTGAWLRADYLAQLWERVVDRHEALSEELARVRFNPAIRGFHLGRLDEDARITVAAAMLLEMYKLEDLQRITITGATSESIKDEIEEVLKDKILLLPEELRAQFREEKYYPRLFEKCINDLMEKVKTFVPQKEHEAIQRKLASSDEFFKGMSFGDKVVVQAPEISREEFLRNFKKYIGALEAEFPFQYTLLHDAVKVEISDVLRHYGFTVEEILDLVPTGLAPMDDATDGGLVKRTSTLLVAEETKKKNEILISFALQGLKDKDCVVYVTSKRSSEEILDPIALEDLTRLTVIDLYRDIYTPNSVKAILEDGNVTFIPPSATLFQHSIVEAIKRYPREAHKRIILDAYVDLLKYYGWGRLFEILQKQLSGLRKWNCTVIVTIDQDLVPPLELEEIKKRFDNIIALSGKGKQAVATIQKLHGGTPRRGVIPL